MSSSVAVTMVTARPTTVVRADTTWADFPGLWKPMLDEVWACLHANGVTRGCRNVMLYLDDVPHVEVGVLSPAAPLDLTGRVVRSALPAGPAATTVHRGPFTGVGAAHGAIQRWCATNGRRTTGPRWEIYGPHDDDPAKLETAVYYLLDEA
jgi:effector-binding domain-containing protein